MSVEMTVLALGAGLLVAHVLLAAHYKTKRFGIEWNLSSREETPGELDGMAGRLQRASDNFRETFPVAIVAFGGLILAEKTSETTALAALVWLGARAFYLPIYWAGIEKIRTAIWGVSMLGLLYALGVLLI
ncbi:MAG: MAPEG family protein [Erythrobacter sp.]|jgi:uncharacterized MAPEG superfamily protein|nr:MAPEG family protein [Erythrobacter sp.]